MPRTFLRYDLGQGPRWAEKLDQGFQPLIGDWPSTGALIEAWRDGNLRHDADAAALDARDCTVLSPITRNQQFIAQATNYRSHVREVGIDPDTITSNVFFTKAVSSLSGAFDPIRKPARVALLDYEIELGIVIARPIRQREIVTPANLHQWVAGLVVVNDVSARDIQVPEGQFFKGKSFRSFSPAGPYLVLLEPEDMPALARLRLELSVNGQIRQQSDLDDMIFKPAQTLTELSEVMDLDPGDLIITGTPGGVALQPPGPLVQKIAGLLPPALRFAKFIEGQRKLSGYLQPGDMVRARIFDPQGVIDLGEQVTPVVDA